MEDGAQNAFSRNTDVNGNKSGSCSSDSVARVDDHKGGYDMNYEQPNIRALFDSIRQIESGQDPDSTTS